MSKKQEDFQEMPESKLLIAGNKIVPVLNRFAVSQEELEGMYKRLVNAVHPVDLLVLVLVSLFTVPVFSILFGFGNDVNRYKSYTFQLASHISQAATLAIVLYLLDCGVIVLHSLGFPSAELSSVSKGLAKLLVIGWVAQRVSALKRHLLGRAVSRKPENLGRAGSIDRLLDGLILAGALFFSLDVLDVEMGVGITSVFAFGSAGTLVIGLASQNLATMFVNGMVLTTSDRIAEGDHIRFGNGSNGQVLKIGWFQTTLRHYDDQIEVIPNSELGMQRVTNLSRVKKCRIRQFLRFSYDDADKFDTLLPAILDEIKEACPKVITDGSAPFRCCFVAFKEDHLLVMIDVHFDGIMSMGNAFWNNKQNCLMAIYRAVKKQNVDFVVGLYPNGLSQN